MAAKYRYLIRPDGTIRVASKSPVEANETDTLVCLTQYYQPGEYFWDFGTEQMVGYTDVQLAERRQAKLDAQAAEDAALQAKRDRIATLMSRLTADQAEVVQLVCELGGVPLD